MKSYHAFLVRCWCESDELLQKQETWRFSLMEIGGTPQAPRGFGDFEQLIAYLRSQLFTQTGIPDQKTLGTSD